MNVLVRQPVAVWEGVRGVCLRRLHGDLCLRVVLRQRGAPTFPRRLSGSRTLSTTSLVYGDVSKVPGSGTSDSWTEAASGGWTEAASSSTQDVVQAVADAAQHGQDLASLGLGAWYTPVGLVQILLDSLEASSGLPWWGIIGAATVVMRLLLFPLSVKFATNAAKMAKIQPELAEIMKNLQYYAKIGATELQEKEQLKMAMLYKNNDCSPFTMMTLPFMQLPVFMSFFIALRKMAMGPLESMKTGGMAWFTDLTVTDPTYTLPLIACGIFITNIQLGGEAGETNMMEKKMRRFLTIGSVCLIPVTITFPTAVFMYWIPNSILVTVQMLLLKRPNVRKALGIPIIERKQKQSQSG